MPEALPRSASVWALSEKAIDALERAAPPAIIRFSSGQFFETTSAKGGGSARIAPDKPALEFGDLSK